MNWFNRLIGFLTNPVADIVGGWQARKNIAAESAASIAKAETEFKVTKFKAAAERLMQENQRDYDYDLQVLKNRNNTKMDELIIIVWFTIFIMHFIPATQPYMAAGWVAMGYGTETCVVNTTPPLTAAVTTCTPNPFGPPWWFEFGMVGILVSTLGLMRVLKLFINRFKAGSARDSPIVKQGYRKPEL